MKLFQLMVEHTPDEENIDWTKIEPSVNFLKSPKGVCGYSLPAGALGTTWSIHAGLGLGWAPTPRLQPRSDPFGCIFW